MACAEHTDELLRQPPHKEDAVRRPPQPIARQR
jgi:hypothetical protein